MMALILMTLNLSPQGPPEVRAGLFWTYSLEDQGNVTLRILEASPSDAGTTLKVMVIAGDKVSIRGRVVVGPDRKSVKASMDLPSGQTTSLDLVMPEVKVGSRWELPEIPPEVRPITITDVQPEPTTTPAGSFPNAVKVSAAIEGEPEATMWLAPGVGLLSAGPQGERAIELVDYGPRGAGAGATGAKREVELLTDSEPRVAGPGKRISIEFKDTPVVDAIKQLIQDEPVSIAFRDIPEDLRVTATIRDASPEEAVMLLCAAAGLEWEDVGRDGGVIRMPPSATVGGSRVPLVGAMRVGSRGPSLPSAVLAGPQLTLQAPPGAPWVSPESVRPTFDGGDKLVDLEVKEAPIREAMAKLAEASGIPIHVADPVSNELRVTAKIYQMPLGDVLSMITMQANLVYTVGYVKTDTAKAKYKAGLITAEEYESSKGQPEIHVVPKPELTVSGPGTESARSKPDLMESVRMLQGLAVSRPRTPGADSTAPAWPGLTTCPKCKHVIQPDWKYCPVCGAKVPSPAKPARKAQ